MSEQDLTTSEGVAALMESSNSVGEWNANIAKVQKANGGRYPSFWYKTVILTDLANKVAAKWDGREEIVITRIE